MTFPVPIFTSIIWAFRFPCQYLAPKAARQQRFFPNFLSSSFFCICSNWLTTFTSSPPLSLDSGFLTTPRFSRKRSMIKRFSSCIPGISHPIPWQMAITLFLIRVSGSSFTKAVIRWLTSVTVISLTCVVLLLVNCITKDSFISPKCCWRIKVSKPSSIVRLKYSLIYS
jgi:hypothetical protein